MILAILLPGDSDFVEASRYATPAFDLTLTSFTVNARTIYFTHNSSLATDVLLPNVPQIIASMFYLLYNNTLTSMILAREYSSFGSTRQPFRVTSPANQQKSTYWLQIPYRYALLLMAVMSLLH
jgi:hypothetical protein